MSKPLSYIYFHSRKAIPEQTNQVKKMRSWALSVSKRSGQIATYTSLVSGKHVNVQGTLHSLQHRTERCQVLAKLHGFATFRKHRREEENQIGKHTTFAGAWFHKPSLSGNLQRDPHSCVFGAQQGVCTGRGARLLSAAGLGWGREAAARRRRSKVLCRQPASCGSQPPELPRAELQGCSLAASARFHRSPLWPLFQGSSWARQPIRGAAAAGLKGAAASAAAASRRRRACLTLVTRNSPPSPSTDGLVRLRKATNNCSKSKGSLNFSTFRRTANKEIHLSRKRHCLRNGRFLWHKAWAMLSLLSSLK